jgi:hypothetical protein
MNTKKELIMTKKRKRRSKRIKKIKIQRKISYKEQYKKINLNNTSVVSINNYKKRINHKFYFLGDTINLQQNRILYQ